MGQDPPPPTPEQFAAFCAKYLPTIVARLKRIGVRDADIKDVTQRVLLKVHRYFDQIPAEGEEAWLFVICEQQAATHYRPPYQRLERPEPADYPMPDEDDQYERLELAQFVSQVLKEMDPKLADILVRHVVDEKTLPVIAEELGISRNTAQRRVEEAKKAFQRKVAQALRPATPARRRRLMLLPFGFGALFHDEKAAKPLLERIIKNPLVWWGVLGPIGGYALGTTTKSNAAILPIRHVEPVVMAIELEGGQTSGETRPHGTATPSRDSSPVVTTSVVAPPPLPLVESDLERRTFERARRSIRQQRYSEALAALRRHEQDYPNSQYKAARDKYIAEALEALGQQGTQGAAQPGND